MLKCISRQNLFFKFPIEWAKLRPSVKSLLLPVSPVERFTRIFVLVIIVTEKESKREIQNFGVVSRTRGVGKSSNGDM